MEKNLAKLSQEEMDKVNVDLAAAGVAFEIVRVGSIGWETLLVAIGYP
ncbi:MAG: hypothetical protein E2599_21340, partial [Klebsiella sp.]|nr:hypothetical protein [Klebsiella sp.]